MTDSSFAARPTSVCSRSLQDSEISRCGAGRGVRRRLNVNVTRTSLLPFHSSSPSHLTIAMLSFSSFHLVAYFLPSCFLVTNRVQLPSLHQKQISTTQDRQSVPQAIIHYLSTVSVYQLFRGGDAKLFLSSCSLFPASGRVPELILFDATYLRPSVH